jgi:hypothetical protein
MKDRRHRLWCQPTEPPEKALGVDRTELVQGDEARSPLEAARDPPWICATARRHRRDNHSA